MKSTTPPEIQIGADKVMDVRGIPCSVKHGSIIRAFQDLAPADYFILLNDHDPVRLRDQFATTWPAAFTWDYLESGPENFRVKITKVKILSATTAPLAVDCGGH